MAARIRSGGEAQRCRLLRPFHCWWVKRNRIAVRNAHRRSTDRMNFQRGVVVLNTETETSLSFIVNFLFSSSTFGVTCLYHVARGRGLTITSARIFVQPQCSGPSDSPTTSCVLSCPVEVCVWRSMHHGLRNWAIPLASTSTKTGHLYSVTTSWRFLVHLLGVRTVITPLGRSLAAPRQAPYGFLWREEENMKNKKEKTKGRQI